MQQSQNSFREWEDVVSSASYTSSTSFSDTCSDNSTVANWEEHVASNGTLFFAEYVPCFNGAHNSKVDFARTSIRRHGNKKLSNKLTKFMKVSQKDRKLENTDGTTSDNRYGKLADIKSGEVKELALVISSEDRYRFGRRSSALESILGFTVSPFVDGEDCLMVTGFVENSTISQQNIIKIGDWFKCIDDIEIRTGNIEEVLLQYTSPTKVVLKFHCQDTNKLINDTDCEEQKITSFDLFAKNASKLFHLSSPVSNCYNDIIFSLIILSPEFSDSDTNAIFCYPDKDLNILYKSRGSFLTLNSVLCDELKNKPYCSVITFNSTKFYVSYRHFNKILMLFAISSDYLSAKESQMKADEMVRYLQFCHSTLVEPLPIETVACLNNVCEIMKFQIEKSKGKISFESNLQECIHLGLPKEAQLRIYDALSEMEAMDYRNWNDEPLNSHREFFIFGSALYYDTYLLASHLPVDQLSGLESLLRCRGIFDFLQNQFVKELVIWHEIPMAATTTRYFLAICSRDHLLIAVILQAYEAIRVNSAGYVEEKTISPSLFYIEEIQETLEHLRQGGIESLARVWTTSNKRPMIEKNPLTDFIQNTKRSNSISINKVQSFSTEDVRLSSSLGGSSIQSLTPSEDSNKRRDDSDSASDWDGFPGSHKSSRGIDDLSGITESLWKEVDSIVPSKLTASRQNALYFYVHLDTVSGLILSPMEEIAEPNILENFRAACHLIHNILQNTKKFRRLLAQENTKPPSNKGLVAIKEHGITVRIKDNSGNFNSYSIIGRLFSSPMRELYVCHQPDIPQNLDEIAFRLSFLTAG